MSKPNWVSRFNSTEKKQKKNQISWQCPSFCFDIMSFLVLYYKDHVLFSLHSSRSATGMYYAT